MKRTKRQAGSGVRAGAIGGAMQAAKTEPTTKELRKQAGSWLKELRARAGLSQIQLAELLGLKYYTFISQVENGFGRVPTESMEAWARALGANPSAFARELLSYYEPEMHRLLFEVKS
jgi:DNA-binding XRE family transcriptional regulator